MYEGRKGYFSSLISESNFGSHPLLSYHFFFKQGRQLIGRIWGVFIEFKEELTAQDSGREGTRLALWALAARVHGSFHEIQRIPSLCVSPLAMLKSL